jgi:hypothetical protein
MPALRRQDGPNLVDSFGRRQGPMRSAMAGLSTGLPPAFLPPTSPARFACQPIGGRRLRGVRGVLFSQRQLPIQIRDLLLGICDLLLLLGDLFALAANLLILLGQLPAQPFDFPFQIARLRIATPPTHPPYDSRSHSICPVKSARVLELLPNSELAVPTYDPSYILNTAVFKLFQFLDDGVPTVSTLVGTMYTKDFSDVSEFDATDTFHISILVAHNRAYTICMAKKRVGNNKPDGLLGMAQSGYESAKKTVGEGIEAVERKLGSAARSAKRIGSAVAKGVSPTRRKAAKAVKTAKAKVKSTVKAGVKTARAKVKTAKAKVKAATKRK